MTHNKFFKWFLAVFILVWCIVTLMVLTTPAYIGDMTRIGGYSEQDFAPQQPQTFLQDLVLKKSYNLRDYKSQVDVLVVGDSFSQNLEYGWQNFLAEKTGWSIQTFHMSNVSIPDLIDSKTFRENPPKLFIYEIAELGFHEFKFKTKGQIKNIGKPPEPQLTLNPLPQKKRTKQIVLSYGIDIAPGIHRLKKIVKKAAGSRQKVFDRPLSTGQFFSCKASDRILIYYGVFWKNEMQPAQWQTVNKDLHTLQNKVQENGQTLFLLMVAPDKSSIYKSYIQNPPLPLISAPDQLGDISALNILPMHQALTRKIKDSHEKDIYLPNDTHWGPAGHRVAAETVLEYLKRHLNKLNR